jgi:hypothetical protein
VTPVRALRNAVAVALAPLVAAFGGARRPQGVCVYVVHHASAAAGVHGSASVAGGAGGCAGRVPEDVQ